MSQMGNPSLVIESLLLSRSMPRVLNSYPSFPSPDSLWIGCDVLCTDSKQLRTFQFCLHAKVTHSRYGVD